MQWHVTARCDQSCKHCYLADPRTRQKELESELSTSQCKHVINDFAFFCNKLQAKGHIVFTGGDPLLRKDFFELLAYAVNKGVTASVMGNPFHLDDVTLNKLRLFKIRSYQISLDGMRKIHDDLRKPGSFDASIKALKALKDYGIRTVVMFSLSKYNSKDLIPVMGLVSELGIDAFGFARVCGFGGGRKVTLDDYTPEEYRNILLDAYAEEKRLKGKGSTTWFNKKDHLWTLLLTELGEEKLEPIDGGVIYGGCSMGCRALVVLSDGTVFACRRFFSPIGKLPEQSIMEIFLSDELDKYRNAELKKCSRCSLWQFCRGCPAVAFGKTGVFGSPDPQCWKKID